MSGLQMALFSFPGKVLSNLKCVTYSTSAINYLKPTITLMRCESFMLSGRNINNDAAGGTWIHNIIFFIITFRFLSVKVPGG